MATSIPPELRKELVEHPHQAVPLVDEQTGKTYYVCDEDFLFGQQDDATRARLKSLIAEGIATDNVPQDEAEARIRATLDRVSGPSQ